MVLDVGRWLPEHPGGASIIPKQSLDCDCARFFEVQGRSWMEATLAVVITYELCSLLCLASHGRGSSSVQYDIGVQAALAQSSVTVLQGVWTCT